MTSELLWGSDQQIHLFVYSALVGFGIGVGFDVINGIGRTYAKTRRFLSDVLFCCFTAIVTLFTSLVLNHGNLHPVLILGIFIGMFVEHRVIGCFVSKFVYRSIQLFARLFKEFCVIFKKILRFLYQWIPISGIKSKKI